MDLKNSSQGGFPMLARDEAPDCLTTSNEYFLNIRKESMVVRPVSVTKVEGAGQCVRV